VTRCSRGAAQGNTAGDEGFGLLALGFDDACGRVGLGMGVCDCDSFVNPFWHTLFFYLRFGSSSFGADGDARSEQARRWGQGFTVMLHVFYLHFLSPCFGFLIIFEGFGFLGATQVFSFLWNWDQRTRRSIAMISVVTVTGFSKQFYWYLEALLLNT
jgi:hypothetical protein